MHISNALGSKDLYFEVFGPKDQTKNRACQTTPKTEIIQSVFVNASARPPRLAGLPTVGTCNYGYTGI